MLLPTVSDLFSAANEIIIKENFSESTPDAEALKLFIEEYMTSTLCKFALMQHTSMLSVMNLTLTEFYEKVFTHEEHASLPTNTAHNNMRNWSVSGFQCIMCNVGMELLINKPELYVTPTSTMWQQNATYLLNNNALINSPIFSFFQSKHWSDFIAKFPDCMENLDFSFLVRMTSINKRSFTWPLDWAKKAKASDKVVLLMDGKDLITPEHMANDQFAETLLQNPTSIHLFEANTKLISLLFKNRFKNDNFIRMALNYPHIERLLKDHPVLAQFICQNRDVEKWPELTRLLPALNQIDPAKRQIFVPAKQYDQIYRKSWQISGMFEKRDSLIEGLDLPKHSIFPATLVVPELASTILTYYVQSGATKLPYWHFFLTGTAAMDLALHDLQLPLIGARNINYQFHAQLNNFIEIKRLFTLLEWNAALSTQDKAKINYFLEQYDFSITGLIWDCNGNLHDLCNGFDDLQSRTLRMLGNPSERLNDRTFIRAMYFIAAGFTPDPKLEQALRQWQSEEPCPIEENVELMKQYAQHQPNFMDTLAKYNAIDEINCPSTTMSLT